MGRTAASGVEGGNPVIHIVTAAPSTKGRTYPADCIAVNRAAITHKYTHVVAGDTRTVKDLSPAQPGQVLWTMKNQTPIPAGWPLLGRFDLLPGWTDLGKPANWSVQGAIAVAVHLGWRWMVIHGTDACFDWPTSTADCSGYDGPDADRNKHRWERERADLDLSISWAQSKGATVYLDRT